MRRKRQGIKKRRTACAVKKSVTRLDGIVNLIRTSRIVDLPQTEADLGQLLAVVQFDSWARHICCLTRSGIWNNLVWIEEK